MRKSSAFYKELHDLRDQYGETEYSREDILPATMALLEKHGCSREDLLRGHATATLDSIERGEDKVGQNGQCEFDYEAHVALGEGMRIRRGMMNADQLRRRERVIDTNKASQDYSWAREKTWIRSRVDALKGYPITAVVMDVLAAEEALT